MLSMLYIRRFLPKGCLATRGQLASTSDVIVRAMVVQVFDTLSTFGAPNHLRNIKVLRYFGGGERSALDALCSGGRCRFQLLSCGVMNSK